MNLQCEDAGSRDSGSVLRWVPKSAKRRKKNLKGVQGEHSMRLWRGETAATLDLIRTTQGKGNLR